MDDIDMLVPTRMEEYKRFAELAEKGIFTRKTRRR